MAQGAYLCRRCRRGCEAPDIDRSFFAHAFGTAPELAPVCPHCGSGELAPALPCGNPGCCGVRGYAEELCADCTAVLRRRLYVFLKGLSPAELEQADEWLEGSSLEVLLRETQREAER